MKKIDFDKRLMDDMGASMGRMRASDDLYDDVMTRAEGGRKRRRGHARSVPVVAALALGLVLATGGTVYAVTNGAFFQRAWGGHGMGDGWTEPVDPKIEGLVPESYSQDFTSTIDDDMPANIADAVENVNYVAEHDGYKLTIDAVVVDANGSGAATFTLTNPGGIDYNPNYGWPGELVFGNGSDLRLLEAEYANGDHANTYAYYDKDTSTDTKVHGTMYFASFKTRDGNMGSAGAGIRWRLAFDTKVDGKRIAGGYEYDSYDAYTPVFKPTKVLPARTLTDSDGDVLTVTPISIVFAPAEEMVGARENEVYRLSLTLDDGREVVILDHAEGISNYYSHSWRDDAGSSVVVSTRLVDPATVVGAKAVGRTVVWDLEPEDGLEPLDVTLTSAE